jgi:hypothetical protein
MLGMAGTTAVWAEENTREGIWNGMMSKETYGTSGTMIRLRFFGGWDYSKGQTQVDNPTSPHRRGIGLLVPLCSRGRQSPALRSEKHYPVRKQIASESSRLNPTQMHTISILASRWRKGANSSFP